MSCYGEVEGAVDNNDNHIDIMFITTGIYKYQRYNMEHIHTMGIVHTKYPWKSGHKTEAYGLFLCLSIEHISLLGLQKFGTCEKRSWIVTENDYSFCHIQWVDYIHLSCGVNIHEPFISMVSCQKGPTSHAYAWQIGPFWQDTLDIACIVMSVAIYTSGKVMEQLQPNRLCMKFSGMPWCIPGSLTNRFIWSWCREKRSRHSQRMRNFRYLVRGPWAQVVVS